MCRFKYEWRFHSLSGIRLGGETVLVARLSSLLQGGARRRIPVLSVRGSGTRNPRRLLKIERVPVAVLRQPGKNL